MTRRRGITLRRQCAGVVMVVMIVAVVTAAAAAPPLVELATEPPGANCAPRPDVVRAAALVASTPSGTAVFQASARPAIWSGNFTRSALSVDDAGAPLLSAPQWDAAALLDALPDASSSRRIYTSKLVQGVRLTVPLVWEQLSAAQRTALNRPPPPAPAAPDQRGKQRLAWLRGDRSQEGRLFRPRGSLLGDAVNSAPVYAGSPSAGVDGGDTYRAHYDRNQSRSPAVYLGANDGMLHAFDAASGRELFAYVPDALFPRLNLLPEQSYVHGAFVDGPASIAEAQVAGAWKTVLVSAMGAGGQGVFALDVTSPTTFPQNGGVLWEFTDRDDAAMGNVTALPQIARLRLRSDADEVRHFVIVSSGVNNHAADGNADAGNASALFLLALDKPAGEAWRLNRNYYRLQAPAGEPGRVNALSAPALVLDRSGALRFAYAGDLQGKLWRFNFSAGAPWRSAVEGPVFVARDAKRTRQPISGQPRAVNAPDGGYLILFGTGQLFGASDRNPADYAQQSFYAVLDDSPGARAASDDHAAPRAGAAAEARASSGAGTPAAATAGAGWPFGRADLAERTLEGLPGGAMLELRGPAFTYGGAAGKQGWYVDFAGTAGGERSVTGALAAHGQVYFNTVITGASACAPIASRSYAMDTLTGLAPDSDGLPMSGEPAGGLVADHLPGPPAAIVTAMAPAARQAGGRSAVGKRITAVNLGARAASAPTSTRTRAVVTAGRIGWREVSNWRELHRAARAREGRP
jgi:type IV pilus assembly protein PilY1